jgi:CheY-like chemotaxis protein
MPDQALPNRAQMPTVLLLDDEPTIRETARHFLSLCGYRCVEADSIQKASEILKTAPVEAAILDVRLSHDESGLEFLKQFRQHEELSHVPVLIMTGSILTPEEEAAITRQRAVLFYKPEGLDNIVKFLDQLTGRDRSH